MKTPITVRILLTVNDPHREAVQTMTLETIRVGFPTAHIIVSLNGNARVNRVRPSESEAFFDMRCRIQERCAEIGAEYLYLAERIHHADFIERAVEYGAGNGDLGFGDTTVIVDGDCRFHESCEDWKFEDETLMAGYFVPRIWNEFAQCVSFSRLHTSCLVFPKPRVLRKYLRDLYPFAHEAHGEYCPINFFRPEVRFLQNGRPFFWDTCCNLFLAIRGFTEAFGPGNLKCFDHINSASFFDIMCRRMERPLGFIHAHSELAADHTKVKNLWPVVTGYYQDMRKKANSILLDIP